MLKRGATGKPVREMKSGLAIMECLSQALVNDQYDWDTVEAVKEFQRKEGLDETGIFDEETRKVLNQKLAATG